MVQYFVPNIRCARVTLLLRHRVKAYSKARTFWYADFPLRKSNLGHQVHNNSWLTKVIPDDGITAQKSKGVLCQVFYLCLLGLRLLCLRLLEDPIVQAELVPEIRHISTVQEFGKRRELPRNLNSVELHSWD